MGTLPVNGTISQRYGVKNSDYKAGYHTGLDISAPAGSAIRSPVGGTVIFAGWYGSYGNAVKVRHADGSIGLYAHMSAYTVRVGQKIKAGTQIGKVGSTGYSTGNHLHWEVRKPGDRYGSQFSPTEWLSNQRNYSSTSTSRSSSRGAQWVKWNGSNTNTVIQNAYNLIKQAGGTDYQAKMLASFVIPESGGDPRIVNSIGATGLWQILWPVHKGWLGKKGFTQENLKDPLMNAKAALEVWKERKSWGGNPLHAWEVYTKGMSQKYERNGLRQTGTIGGGGGGSGNTTSINWSSGGGVDYFDMKVKKATPKQLAAGAGFSIAFFKSDPELWKLFQKARKRGDIDATNLVADLKNSRWWKKHSEAQRQAEALQASDPAEWKSRKQDMRKQIQDIDGTLGTTLSSDEINKVMNLALYNGWSEAKIRDFMINLSDVNKVLASGDDAKGQAGDLQDAFQRIAAEYGQNPSNKVVRDQVMRVLRGDGTEQDFLSWAQTRAKQMYRHLADDIDKGFTVADIARPYVQTAAELLEKNVDELGLDSTFVQKALKGDGKTTMDMSEFTENLRRSEEWQYTDNARQTYMGIGNDILNAFGFRG